MKPTLPLISLLLLAGCGSSTITYDLAFSSIDDVRLEQELARQSMNVIERRLDRMGEKPLDMEISIGETTQIEVQVSSKDIADILTSELTEPFSLSVMSETDLEHADITVEGHGSFEKTDITEADFEWVQAREDKESGQGEVRILLTEEGRTKMAAIFRVMKGKSIGIFVRDRLVSKLKVDTDELKDDIVIQGIPDPAMAEVFAEDVNVGLHVTFTPAP